MGVIIPDDYALVSLHSKTDGDNEDMVTTFGISVGTANDVPGIPAMIASAWDEHIDTITSSQHTLVLVRVKLGPNSTGATLEQVTALTGDNGEGMPPPNTSVLIRKSTLTGGRKGRGRMYWPGISVQGGSATAAGTFSGADAAVISAAAEAFRDEIETDTVAGPCPWVLLHSDATTPSPITALTCDTRFATQRRRLRP